MGKQVKNKRYEISRLRQSLSRLNHEAKNLGTPFFSDKPVIKGSVYELKRKCGKASCKCNQGELHSRMVVSASEKNKTKLRVIPKGYLVEVKKKVQRYQKLRRSRKKIIEVQQKIIQVIDEIENIRREEVPPIQKKRT